MSAAPISWVLAVQKTSHHTLQLGSMVGGARPVHMVNGGGKTGGCAIDNHTLVLTLRHRHTHTLILHTDTDRQTDRQTDTIFKLNIDP